MPSRHDFFYNNPMNTTNGVAEEWESVSDQEIDSLSHGFELRSSPEDCIFLVHGFTGSASELYPLATVFRQLGYSVISHPLPSSGDPSLKALKKGNPKIWRSSVLEGYRKAKAKYPHVYVIGYSMGGDLAILLSEDEKLEGLVLLEVALEPNAAHQWAAHLLRYTPIHFSWGDDPIHFPHGTERFWRGQNGYYVKSADDLLRVAHQAKKVVPHLSCPLMLTWAGKDTSIKKEGVDYIASHAKSSLLLRKEYPENTHHLPSEPELKAFAKDVDEFIQKIKTISK